MAHMQFNLFAQISTSSDVIADRLARWPCPPSKRGEHNREEECKTNQDGGEVLPPWLRHVRCVFLHIEARHTKGRSSQEVKPWHQLPCRRPCGKPWLTHGRHHYQHWDAVEELQNWRFHMLPETGCSY
jgi:hypothetical protein